MQILIVGRYDSPSFIDYEFLIPFDSSYAGSHRSKLLSSILQKISRSSAIIPKAFELAVYPAYWVFGFPTGLCERSDTSHLCTILVE